MGSATCATALATNKHVETTPTTGANGRIFFTKLGKNLFVAIPTAIGPKTTWMVEKAIPAASTGTTAPKSVLQIRGVMKIAPIVVAVVMMTDNATLPLAMYVHKFEAWPPLILPTRTIPANNAASRPNAFARPNAKKGIIA